MSALSRDSASPTGRRMTIIPFRHPAQARAEDSSGLRFDDYPLPSSIPFRHPAQARDQRAQTQDLSKAMP